MDDARVPGRREIVETRVVERCFDDEREEQRLLGDVRHRQTGVYAEAQAGRDEHGERDEGPLVTKEEQLSR